MANGQHRSAVIKRNYDTHYQLQTNTSNLLSEHYFAETGDKQ